MVNRRTPFVSVNLTEEARDVLRQAVLDLTTPVGRRLSMSDVVLEAVGLAMQHKGQMVKRLAGKPDDA
jgi:hypothetical protein